MRPFSPGSGVAAADAANENSATAPSATATPAEAMVLRFKLFSPLRSRWEHTAASAPPCPKRNFPPHYPLFKGNAPGDPTPARRARLRARPPGGRLGEGLGRQGSRLWPRRGYEPVRRLRVRKARHEVRR